MTLLKKLFKKNNTINPENVDRNWSYTIKEGEHAGVTLWNGRYCAVCGIVYTQDNSGDIFVLANKRGSGTPDYQGYWNLPCGYLEVGETGKEGVCREILEETGYIFTPGQFKLEHVQTSPKECNNGNVTIFYKTNIQKTPNRKKVKSVEKEEVAGVRWISINEIHKYEWAFGHDKIIKSIFWNKL